MPELRFTLTLLTDAEPGTGRGTELINDIVPRDEAGHPYIPASHLKGVARDEFRLISSALGWSSTLESVVFGAGGMNPADESERSTESFTDGAESAVRFSACLLAKGSRCDKSIGQVSRTALNAFGTANSGSLRTVESIAAGSVFDGAVTINSDDPEIVDAVRLALLSLTALGGNRTRGAGRCLIQLRDEPDALPSKILRRLHPNAQGYQARPRARTRNANAGSIAEETVLLELTFEAHDAVCCPVTPLTGTNTIRGGFAIPASAVQGALLHLLDRNDHELASSLFASTSFRAWPLLPVGHAGEGEATRSRRATLTSLTHRVSKSAAGLPPDSPWARDRMIEPYHWRDVHEGAPLKSGDGVLITEETEVRLWKSAHMPRRITAHVNLQQANGEPLLFTVEAMAPAIYKGWLTVPASVADALLAELKANPTVSFGRSKAVRGSGLLSASKAQPTDITAGCKAADRTFVLQSPALIPRAWVEGKEKSDTSALLKRLVEESGLGECAEAEAAVEIRFGWNRHSEGGRVAQTNRLVGEPVFAPGAIFVLKDSVADPVKAMLRGLGGGRERGFGAFLPHPGIAQREHRPASETPTLSSKDNAGRVALELIKLSIGSGLSTSAIAQLVRLAEGEEALGEFLGRQKDRPANQWNRWKPVAERLLAITLDRSISNETRARIFRAWTDDAAAKGGY